MLHPLHIQNQKWEEISMYFIEFFLMSDGKDKIFFVGDRITKHAHFMAIKKTDSAKKIADIFCRNIYKLHRLLKVIISDRDVIFKGKFWK